MRTVGSATLASAALGLVLLGCSARRLTLTERSAVEQELLVRSLERAVADLETTSFAFDRATGRFVARVPQGTGRSKFDEFGPARHRLHRERP